jgi:hypothetical protein
MFVVAGAVAVQGWFGRRSKDAGQMARPVLAVILLVLGFAAVELTAQALGISRRKQWSGFGDAAEEIVLEDPGAKRTVMVASDAVGERIFIAELAMRERRPGHVVKLASRELTQSSRYSRDLSPRFETEEDVAAWFANAGVDYLLIDESIPEAERERYQDVLFRSVDSHTQRFWPMAKSNVVREENTQSASLTLYRVKHVD